MLGRCHERVAPLAAPVFPAQQFTRAELDVTSQHGADRGVHGVHAMQQRDEQLPERWREHGDARAHLRQRERETVQLRHLAVEDLEPRGGIPGTLLWLGPPEPWTFDAQF